MDDHTLHSIKKKAGRTEHSLYDALLSKVSQLGSGEVGRLEALVTLLPQVVEYEIDEIAVDSARGDGKALLCLRLFSLCQAIPRHVHLMVHAANKHGVLGPRCHALEDEDRIDPSLSERFQLLVHETEDAGRDSAESICEGIFQGLDGAEPEHSIDPHLHVSKLRKLSGVYQILLLQMGLEMSNSHRVAFSSAGGGGGVPHSSFD
mmetsp:Transcript_78964/g.189578  ORF Transcript_78964/g.189578 Transcript_78964/m.189578 type:complete len:205 (+) Transcript_78964:1777-2391(+)